jgi:hypothetical protein
MIQIQKDYQENYCNIHASTVLSPIKNVSKSKLHKKSHLSRVDNYSGILPTPFSIAQVKSYTESGPFLATQVKSYEIEEESWRIEEADIPSSHELLGRPAVHDLMERLEQETRKGSYISTESRITASQEDGI